MVPNMKMPTLDTAIRDSLAQRLLAALQAAQPGSIAQLRGSLAAGTADAYSDIDLLWEVPDESFQTCMESLAGTLAGVYPVASLRSDPAFRQSSRHRLVFIQFEGMPLFWRVDLEVFAFSIHRDPEFDRQDTIEMDPDWSPTHSALMNAIAAIKALLRGREAEARGLLARGFERIGVPAPEGNSPQQVTDLCQQVARLDPRQALLAQQVLDLHRQVFG